MNTRGRRSPARQAPSATGDRPANRRASLALRRASRWLEDAKDAAAGGRWDSAVYHAQMAAETALKALLLAIGRDAPRRHDISRLIHALSDEALLPLAIRGGLPAAADVLRALLDERGRAGYGWEEEVTEESFRERAPSAIRQARGVVDLVAGAMRSLSATRNVPAGARRPRRPVDRPRVRRH